MWYKFWVFGSSPFDAIYGQVDNGYIGNYNGGPIKIRYAFSVQPSEGGMAIVPLTKNKQGDGIPFTTIDEYLHITPAMWAQVDESDQHFHSVISRISIGIEVPKMSNIILGNK